MLEKALEENTAALTRLAEVLEKGGGVGAGGTTTGGAKASAKSGGAKKPKNTAEQVKAAIMKVKDDVSADAAKAIIEKHAGKGKKLADLANDPSLFDAAVADAEAALEEAGGDEPDADDDI